MLYKLQHGGCMIALMLLGGLVVLRHQAGRWRGLFHFLLISLTLVGVWQYSNFGDWHGGGRFVHISELSQYYLGAKYYEELGYTNLYRGIAAGLETELGKKLERVRDLNDKRRYQTQAELESSSQEIRGHFPQKRWKSFLTDLRGINDLNPNWDAIVLDAGYNVSPFWTLCSRAVTWIPLHYWGVLTRLDAALLAVIVALLGFGFGWEAALMGLCLFLYFPSGEYSTFNWTGGALLRLSWVLWLTLGLVLFQRRKFTLAGAALAAATLERLFPGGFALAGAAVLLCSCVKKNNKWADLFRYGAGGILAAALVVGITSARWPGCWTEFAGHIHEHSSQFLFTNHFGWRRALSFYPQMGEVDFNSYRPGIFADWSTALQTRTHWPFFAAALIVTLVTLWVFAANGLPAMPAIVLMGFGAVYFLSIPAHYYLTLLLPMGAVLAARQGPQDDLPLGVTLGFWGLWPLCSLATSLDENTGWALASLVMFGGIVFITATLVTGNSKYSKAAAFLATALVFAGLGAIIRPKPGTPPPPAWKQAVPASCDSNVKQKAERYFPDASGHIIHDYGLALTSNDWVNVFTPPAFSRPEGAAAGSADSAVTNSTGGSARDFIHLIIRTDRFFPGTLQAWDKSGKVLGSQNVEGRGYIFDTIALSVPLRNQYALRWMSRDNIGIFQVWICP